MAKLRPFMGHVVPELVFLVVSAVAVTLAWVWGGESLEHTVGLVALLVITSEVLVRWSFFSERKTVEALSERVERFGLAIRDHVQLGDFARSYLDSGASLLAKRQEDL